MSDNKPVEWITAGHQTPCPTIIGNRQSEAIEGLLKRLDTCIRRQWKIDHLRFVTDDDYKKQQQERWPRQETKIALLESGRHLLVAIQYFLYFLFCREQLKGNSAPPNPVQDTPISPETSASATSTDTISGQNSTTAEEVKPCTS